jgi:hypothetical protein
VCWGSRLSPSGVDCLSCWILVLTLDNLGLGLTQGDSRLSVFHFHFLRPFFGGY